MVIPHFPHSSSTPVAFECDLAQIAKEWSSGGKWIFLRMRTSWNLIVPVASRTQSDLAPEHLQKCRFRYRVDHINLSGGPSGRNMPHL